MTKKNPYTDQEYECKCDYSYTCDGCEAVREGFQQKNYHAKMKLWTVTAIQKIAKSLGVPLDEPPTEPKS